MTAKRWEARVHADWLTAMHAFDDRVPDFDVFRAVLECSTDTIDRVASLDEITADDAG